ncbi:hypothetical protein [Paenibacillus roseus]|uniref:Uncharacterized protein n=1 Tax=Paenibacillus roseus TaxID=2798579 RepID=A0A934JBK0_9BACL|nr:hypothetical protein [Paenibacillus roseus]MBJ6364042.1 hypothetical protein [Paenibacillus roseus]
MDGIVSTYASTPTFEEVLMYTTQTAMVSDLRIFKDWRFKTGFGKFDDSSNILHFNRWNEDKSNPLQLIQPNIQISKDMKIQLMKELFDQDPHVRTNAEARYAEWYSEKI